MGLVSVFLSNNIISHGEISVHLGFSTKCSIDLDHALRGFNRHQFWREILGQNIIGEFQPRNMNIQPHKL